LAKFTPKQIEKVPEQASLTRIAAALHMTYDAVYRWTHTPGLSVTGQPIPPLTLRSVDTPGGAQRLFVLRADLLSWLESTGRYHDGDAIDDDMLPVPDDA
jgi:hypothetical protein